MGRVELDLIRWKVTVAMNERKCVLDKVRAVSASITGKGVSYETHGTSIESSGLVSPVRECPPMLMYWGFSEREGTSRG
jgi:hypothetical protein